ncbi:uncharacterized protein LOC110993182 [Pieris rapae]|uniref:uncharacterized protein LOC110993182 n=1 Tax=Pieris rapae TaxID=64459 RepID=UPI001E281191|nr:uncharacterized protein LOC110993182 [Pieris rapae]
MPSSIRAKQNVTRIYKGPKIIVEQSQNLPVPIKISLIKPKTHISSIKKPTAVNFLKAVNFRSKHAAAPQPPLRRFRTPICRWFRRKRALNQLVKEHKKELKVAAKRKQAKFERERLKDFIRWESLKPKISTISAIPTEKQKHKPFLRKPFKSPKSEKTHVQPDPIKLEPTHKDLINWARFKRKKSQNEIEKPMYTPPSKVKHKPPEPVKYNQLNADATFKYMTSPIVEKQPKFYYDQRIYEPPRKYEPVPKVEKKYKTPVIVARECRGLCISEKPAQVQPVKKSKSVYVKKYNHRESFTNKFVNCFYRVCCQFYCYLTCIIIIACCVMCLI